MNKCEHYWVIPNTTEGTCQGICRMCNARKEFLNRMPVNQDWESPVRQVIRSVSGGQHIAELADE